MRTRVLLAVVVLVAAGGMTRADEKPLERSELDKRIVNIVYEAAVLGTDLFNEPKRNYEGCYRLYEGTLMAVAPLLDHRPKLQAAVKTRLDRAKKMKAPDAAFELRTAINEIQDEIAPSKDKPKAKDTTLWERLGGEKGVRKAVDEIVLRAAEDKKVNFFRDGKVKLDPKGVDHLKQMLVEFVSAHTGGPFKYTGKSMKEAHKGMMITHAEFEALRDIIVDVLKKNNVADADISAVSKLIESTRADIVEPKK